MFEVRAQADDTVEVKIYGTIHQWSDINARSFDLAVDRAEASKPKTIVFPIHSGGGSTLEGIAMGNRVLRLRAKGIKTIARIDGLAASMASAFACFCDEVLVSPFSRIMIHEAQGGIFGTAKQLRNHADLVEKTTKDLAQIYASRTGKEVKWIEDNWLNGKDNWFTADEAIKNGLADDKIPAVVKNLPKLAAIAQDWNAIAAAYDPFFSTDTDTTEDAMNKETKAKLIKSLRLKEDATDEEILAAVEAASKAPEQTPKEDKETKTEMKVDDEKKALVESAVALAKERGMPEAKLESFRKIAEMDLKAAMDLIPAQKETVNVADLIKQFRGDGADVSNRGADKRNWTYDDWCKNDPNGLIALAKEKPAEYSELFNATFGYKPSEEEMRKMVSA